MSCFVHKIDKIKSQNETNYLFLEITKKINYSIENSNDTGKHVFVINKRNVFFRENFII